MKTTGWGENKNIISHRLRAARKQCGLSQEELAARMQIRGIAIDQQSISKIERNQRIVTDYELLALCQILHLNPSKFLGLECEA